MVIASPPDLCRFCIHLGYGNRMAYMYFISLLLWQNTRCLNKRIFSLKGKLEAVALGGSGINYLFYKHQFHLCPRSLLWDENWDGTELEVKYHWKYTMICSFIQTDLKGEGRDLVEQFLPERHRVDSIGIKKWLSGIKLKIESVTTCNNFFDYHYMYLYSRQKELN